jgi:pilus assembly protein CpaF
MFKRFAREERVEPPHPVLPDEPQITIPEPAPLPDARRSRTDLKVRIHQELLEILNLSVIEKLSREQFSGQLSRVVRDMLAKDGIALNSTEYATLIEEILDEVLGLGPLEPFLKDPTVSDILVNTHEQIFVERFGKLEETPAHFKDEKHLVRIIQRIVSAVGRRVDESQPWVDARLADGSRVNAMVPPCAVDGPLVSIRKFAKIPFSIDKLIESGAMTEQISELLNAVVKSRLNIIVSGGTGSGKTTMLNALSSQVSDNERIITIEDTAELQLQQKHLGRMESRPANMEGSGEVSQRELLKNARRMRPDRIIVGEVRGAEVLDMLQAMNTGHDGSMTTIHANSSRDAVTRLENMIGMTGIDIPMKSLRSQIASAVDVIIQLQRFSDGKRRLVSVQELVGIEGDVISMQEIFKFQRTGVDADGNVLGSHVATGVRPKFSSRLKEWGFEFSEDTFSVV